MSLIYFLINLDLINLDLKYSTFHQRYRKAASPKFRKIFNN